jgi:hypothetical protein
LGQEGAEVVLRLDDDIRSFTTAARRARQRVGRPYFDLATGTLFVDAPRLLLYLRLEELATPRLSPYQCALLAPLLEHEGGKWLEREGRRSQVEFARLLRLDLGVDVSPMNVSRFMSALSARGIAPETDTFTLDRSAALGALRDDFRLTAVGQVHRFAGAPSDVESALEPLGKERLARGVADVLARETGAIIEPRDYVVDRDELPRIRAALGAPVKRDYGGAHVLIRAAQRVPFALLTLGRGSLQPLLAVVGALRSESPVARGAAEEAFERRLRAWS